MKRNYLKQFGGIALSVILAATTVMPAMAADDAAGTTGDDSASVWTLGKKTNVNGPEDGKQGTNGWYFMYTNQTDVAKDAKYDTAKFKECTWADKGSKQLKSEDENAAYDAMWVPADYLKDGLTGKALEQPNADNPTGTFNNWVMTSNGTLNPSVETTAVTGVYAWEAPKDGEYNYELNYEAGGDHCDLDGTRYYYVKDYYIKDGTSEKKTPEQREGGVAVSVSTKDSKKSYEQCIAKTPEHDYLYNGQSEGTVELKKGEKIYFAVDPREVGTYDMSNLDITITTAGSCDWSEPVYTWDDENHTCTATRTCATHKGHISETTVEGTLEKTNKKATCTEEGEGVYSAYFKKDGLKDQLNHTSKIAKLGHDTTNAYSDFYEGKYKAVWSEDFKTCTWQAPCKNCGEYVDVETSDNITMKAETASCTEPGTFTYNASFYWGWVWITSAEQTTDKPLGHDFSNIYNAKYEWTSDNTMCSKTLICNRDNCDEEKEGDTVQTTVAEEPTCTKAGKVTASFDWGYDVQKKEIPALGHDWGEWTTVSKATTSKPEVQKRTCKRCNESETKEVGKVLPTKVSKITLKGVSKKIAAGKSVQLAATVSPSKAANKAVKWTSSNKKYATVNSKGKVTTKAAGRGKTVKITATAADGSKVKGTYTISIMKNAVKSISLKASATKVKAGKKATVKATVKTTGRSSVNKTLKWTSSNKKYATVSSKGVVTTKAAGKGKTVKITAKATDGTGRSKTIKIKIVK